MYIRASYGVSLIFFVNIVAFGAEKQMQDFDKLQNGRLSAVQRVLGSDMTAARNLAKSQSSEITENLKLYEKYGVHQRIAASRYASALVTKDVLENLVSFSMYSGQDITTVANYYLSQNFGVELNYDTAGKKWDVSFGSDKARSITKIREVLSKSMDKDLWNGLPDDIKNDVASLAMENLASEMTAVAPKNEQLSDSLKATFQKKVDEYGNNDKGKIYELKKDVSVASADDAVERRLLLAEKKAMDEVAASTEAISESDFCSKYAGYVAEPNNLTDLKRRMDASGSSSICQEPLKAKYADIGKGVDRKPAITDEPKDNGLMAGGLEDGDDDSEATDDDDKDDDDKEETSREKKERRKRQEAEKANADLATKVSQLEEAAKTAQGREDQLKNALNFQQACKAGVGASASDPFSLNPDNQRNEKMITSLKDEMEKVLVSNYTATVCEQVSKGKSVRTASQNLIDSLVPPGALTEADQKTLKGITQEAIDQAGLFARKRGTRMKLQYQLEAAASKKALTRLAMENSNLLNVNTVPYLKNLTHNDLVGYDGYGLSGALAKASTNPNDPFTTIQTYQALYDSALIDLKSKYGTGDDYEYNAECALTLAQEASSRWSEEAGRSSALFGPSRQNAYNALRGLSSGVTEINSAPSSGSTPKRRYR